MPDISSFVITCTYLFTTDDNHLQKSSILSSVICVIAVIISTQVWSFFFSELDRGIMWKFCIKGCYSLALLITHFISFAVQRRLLKFHSIHNKSQSWHLTNHSSMVEIISIRNYAFHDPMPDDQLNILWQIAVSDLYIFDHQRVNISLGSILERFIPQSKVDHSELWRFVKCGFI